LASDAFFAAAAASFFCLALLGVGLGFDGGVERAGLKKLCDYNTNKAPKYYQFI
jgi:hypothetical protein